MKIASSPLVSCTNALREGVLSEVMGLSSAGYLHPLVEVRSGFRTGLILRLKDALTWGNGENSPVWGNLRG